MTRNPPNGTSRLFVPCILKSAWACVIFSGIATAQTPAHSTYGAGDRLGALNNLSPEIVVQTAGLIKTGKVYSLAIETEPSKELPVRSYRAIIQPFSSPGSNRLTGYEDTVVLSLSLGTSVDGLGHVGRDGVHYNGVKAEDLYSVSGATIFGIETLPPIVTRGILLDFARHRGESAVPNGTVINQADIEAVCKAQGVTIRRGDVVLLHLGTLESTEGASSVQGNPGLGKGGARYLAKLGVVAVSGAEVSPAETKGEIAPVHQILLVDNGVYIFEGIKTDELAADRAYEFLFMAAAPRLPGTVQATIHPVAIR